MTQASTGTTVDTNEITVVFTLVEGDYMNFKSSLSDDMDDYIWTKADPVEADK